MSTANMPLAYIAQPMLRQGISVAYYCAKVVLLPGLQRLRLLAALTQGELAGRAEVQRQTVSRLERGGQAEPATVRRLSKALGCQPRELIEPER